MPSVLSPTRRTATIALAAVALMGTGSAAAHAATSPAPAPAAFDAMVRLPNCSGSLVRFSAARDTDKALVLTNGHCVGPRLGGEEFRVDQPANITAGLMRGDDAQQAGEVRLDRLVYATMSGTDVALYRTTKTYAQLKAAGVVARRMSTQRPVEGTALVVPSSYWRRTFRCTVTGFVPTLKEGPWTWNDAIRFEGSPCDPTHGASGTPLLGEAGDVVGILNTVNEGGDDCSVNNPCEVGDDGTTTSYAGQTYGEQTYQLDACYRPGRFDLGLPGCTVRGGRG